MHTNNRNFETNNRYYAMDNTPPNIHEMHRRHDGQDTPDSAYFHHHHHEVFINSRPREQPVYHQHIRGGVNSAYLCHELSTTQRGRNAESSGHAGRPDIFRGTDREYNRQIHTSRGGVYYSPAEHHSRSQTRTVINPQGSTHRNTSNNTGYGFNFNHAQPPCRSPLTAMNYTAQDESSAQKPNYLFASGNNEASRLHYKPYSQTNDTPLLNTYEHESRRHLEGNSHTSSFAPTQRSFEHFNHQVI